MNKSLILVCALVFLVACAPQPPEPIACTEEAKICPDGSVVVRVGPDCEFQSCPQVEPTDECNIDTDCAPAQCCHPTSCVPVSQAPDCEGTFCTQECRPGTIDCGGRCFCEENKCQAQVMEPAIPGETETQESCKAKGGDWQRRFIGWFCNYPADDAGQPCMNGEECQGMCLAEDPMQPQGACSDYKVVFGCITVFDKEAQEKGLTKGLCID